MNGLKKMGFDYEFDAGLVARVEMDPDTDLLQTIALSIAGEDIPGIELDPSDILGLRDLLELYSEEIEAAADCHVLSGEPSEF